jgi:1-acyl-sn-glycerol-3-phosphate acyltransferase
MPDWTHLVSWPPFWFLLLIAASASLAAVRHGLARILNSGDPAIGAAYLVAWVWIRLFHGYRIVLDVPLPRPFPEEGCLVLCNHASGLDPIALQLAIPRKLAWMMAQDQMHHALARQWSRFHLIPVTYGPKDTASLREAVRTVRGGGILAIFPEGGIVRPPREVRPFLEGAGLVASMTGAPILLYWIDGAPYSETAYGALLRPSQTRVHFLGEYRFPKGTPAGEVVGVLRERLLAVSGWTANETPLPGIRNGSARSDSPVPSPE